MTNEERKALEDLIEAVEAAINAGDWKVDGACDPTLALIRAKEALAKPEQEPVKLVSYNCKCGRTMNFESVHGVVAPQRKPLTDEEILTVARDHYNPHQRPEISFARAIEAAHGIKE